jgi:hypothetical protein
MSSVTQTDQTAAKASRILWALGLVLVVAGWLSILHVYRWHFTAPVFFLWMGWAGLLLSARFLYRAGLSMAEDTGEDHDDFWKPVGRHEELLLEKRSLLKAIKEIEFDRELGKMSEEDATELTRFYRQRAIEIIKTLESEGAGDETLSVQEQIEREVKARLVVAGAGAKGKALAARGEAGRKAPAGDEAARAPDETVTQTATTPATTPAGQTTTQAPAKAPARPADKKKAAKAKKQKASQAASAGQQPDTAAKASVAGEQAGPDARPAAEDAS